MQNRSSTPYASPVLPIRPGIAWDTADVSTVLFDPDTSNNTSTDDVVVPPLVDLTITKSHIDPVAVGGRITYTVTVTNNGPTLDPGPISISDNLPVSLVPVTAGGPGVTCGILLQLVTCTSDVPLGVDASLTVTIVADVLPSAYPSVTNVALVSTASTETDLSNNTATHRHRHTARTAGPREDAGRDVRRLRDVVDERHQPRAERHRAADRGGRRAPGGPDLCLRQRHGLGVQPCIGACRVHVCRIAGGRRDRTRDHPRHAG